MEKFLRLAKKPEELKQFINSLPIDEVGKLLEESSRRSEELPINLLKAVFQDSVEPKTDLKCKMHVYECCLDILQQDLETKAATEILGLLLMHTDAFPAVNLATLASKMLDMIKNEQKTYGRWLELFPKVLTAISTQEYVVYDGLEQTGLEYRSHLIKLLSDIKWNSCNVVHLAAMFRDISMTAEEHKSIINKLIEMMKDMDLQEIPALIYQLLLLSLKGEKQIVVEGILSFFKGQDGRLGEDGLIGSEEEESELQTFNAQELLQTEGTVILHILFAMKQDQDLAKEFEKYLKANVQNPSSLLTPFTLSLGLSVTTIRRFQLPIFEVFKSTITKCYKMKEIRRNSVWLQEICPEDHDVEGVFLAVIKNSKCGWDYVMQGLVDFGFLLMETGDAKPGRKTINTGSPKSSPSNSISDLGVHILFNTFKLCHVVRDTILETLLNHIITNLTSSVTQYIKLFTEIVKMAPLFALDSVTRIQQTLDYLSMMPVATAIGFIKALCFIVRYHMGLKDTLIITLRKALFSRMLESRKIAVSGFVLLLKHLKLLGALPSSQSSDASLGSQIFADVHTKFSSNVNEALCLELLGTLRRCLTQQMEIRVMVYEGLCQVVSKNSNFGEPVLELLTAHFFQYYEANVDVSPPLRIDKIISIQNDQVTILEPLGNLIHCLQLCLRIHRNVNRSDGQETSTNESVVTRVEEILASLTRRMVTAELEDFALDKSADFGSVNVMGKRNVVYANTLFVVYEALIEHVLNCDTFKNKQHEKVEQLFKNHQELAANLKGKSGAKKKSEAAKSKLAKPNPTLLSLDVMSRVLACVLGENQDEEVALLQDDAAFTQFVINLVLNRMTLVKESRHFAEDAYLTDTDIVMHLGTIANALQSYYVKSTGEQDAKKIATMSSCLDCLSLIISFVSSTYPTKVDEFLSNLNKDETPAPLSSSLRRSESVNVRNYMKTLQEMVTTALEHKENTQKDIIQLISMMELLSSNLSKDGESFGQLLNWTQKLCTEHSFGHANLVKSLLTFYFDLLKLSKTNKKLVYRDIARDLHSKLGDIDEDIQIEASNHLAIVTEESSATASPILIQELEHMLSLCDCVLVSLKAVLTSVSKDDSALIESSSFKEKKVCVSLAMIVTVLHELVQTAFPPGLTVTSLFKLFTHFFNTMATFCKYFISGYVSRTIQINAQFGKLVNLIGTHLTPQVYDCVTYFQTLRTAASKKRKMDSNAEKAKIIKESQYIPNLIYNIEQYEKFLMQLTKKSSVNLMENVKLSTARDFRIDMKTVREVMAKRSPPPSSSSSDDDEKQDEENRSDSTNKTPPQSAGPLKKRRKLIRLGGRRRPNGND